MEESTLWLLLNPEDRLEVHKENTGEKRECILRSERIRNEAGQKKKMINLVEESQLELYGYVLKIGEEKKAK